jgi:hypothetical protein
MTRRLTMATQMTQAEQRLFAATCEPGDYFVRHQDEAYGDDETDLLRGRLASRGLRLVTDDVGALVTAG